MSSSRPRSLLASLAFLSALAAPASGQLQVQLTVVPDNLVLPVPAGRNVLITVTVSGGEPEAVWLARAPDAAARVPLLPAGAGVYQLNLATPDLDPLLRAPADHGTLGVFAKAKDGSVAASVPIAYALAANARRPSLLVQTKGRAQRIEWASPLWLSPREVIRIDIDLLVPKPTVDATARLGERRLPLVRNEDGGARLEVTADVAEAWLTHGTLEIGARTDPDAPLFQLRARPERLCREGRTEFEVAQRATAFLPGSDEYLRVSLGDISGGRVRLRLHDAEGHAIVAGQVVRQGDEVAFPYAGTTYTLTVERLVNSLLGQDYATLSLALLSPGERALIDDLLDALAASPATFVRNGATHDGKAAAQLLRTKFATEHARIATVEDFIAVVGTRSSTSGEPYLVRSPDGTERELAGWLTEQVATLRAAAKTAQGK